MKDEQDDWKNNHRSNQRRKPCLERTKKRRLENPSDKKTEHQYRENEFYKTENQERRFATRTMQKASPMKALYLMQTQESLRTGPCVC